jgi:dTDP-4-dehydrorhamnose 3,5-epimerase-like enzyme
MTLVESRAENPERRSRSWERWSAQAGWQTDGTGLGCRIVELPRIADPRGNLTVVEGAVEVPFDVQRVYYLYDVPGGQFRGGHAHRGLEQVIIAAAGSFDVIVDDGRQSERFFLNRSYVGLYMPPMIWHELDNFSTGSVALALASQRYDEADYYRDYDEFALDALIRSGTRPTEGGAR